MKHVLSILVQNQPGVLVRVASMFTRRGFNIDSLAVGTTQVPEYSRITAVTHGSPRVVNQMVRQLEKLYEVEAVQVLKAGEAVTVGMAVVKVRFGSRRAEIFRLAWQFAANLVADDAGIGVFVITGDDERIDAFAEMLAPYGVLEITRTGVIGLARGEETIYACQRKKQLDGEGSFGSTARLSLG